MIRGCSLAGEGLRSSSRPTWRRSSEHSVCPKSVTIGVYPEERRGDGPSFDKTRNLILCPVPYDGGFMEVFQGAFFIVKTFLDADAAVPKPVILYLSADRYVAKLLEERRKFPVLDVIDALERFAQPGLLESGSAGDPYSETPTSAVAPVARRT